MKSRESGFFYGHPQNRFWRVTANLFGVAVPQTVAEKKTMILNHRLALWDVIASCEIVGSADSAIREVTPNDLSVILEYSAVSRIFVNGKTAEKYYKKYLEPVTGIHAVCLPSTSPANAAWSIERLTEAWSVILNG